MENTIITPTKKQRAPKKQVIKKEPIKKESTKKISKKEETKEENKEEYQKRTKPTNVKLIVDDRERSVSIHSQEWCDITYETTRITTADYIVVNEETKNILACIERKSLEDFAASIKDGRSENISKLREFRSKTGCRIIYLIEGDLTPKQDKEYAHIPFKTIESAIFHLITRDNICVLRTSDTLDTARLLARFVKSMETLKGDNILCVEGGAAFGEASIEASQLQEMLSQKHIKSDIDIVRELWSAFNGISIASADEYIKVWSLSDIICGRISREQITQHKMSSGRKINPKVATCLMALDKQVETRLLASIPMLSRISANYILLRSSLKDLILLSVEDMAKIAISDKKKLGEKLANNINTYMNYIGI